jgi:hypothetical protein
MVSLGSPEMICGNVAVQKLALLDQVDRAEMLGYSRGVLWTWLSWSREPASSYDHGSTT